MSVPSVKTQLSPGRDIFRDLRDPFQKEIILAPELLALVRLRVAQLHDCPLCIATHSEALKLLGESDARISQLKDWPKNSLFDEAERTALALTEILSADPSGPVPPTVVQEARKQFNEAEILQLVLNVFAANDWIYGSTSSPGDTRQQSGYHRRHGEAN